MRDLIDRAETIQFMRKVMKLAEEHGCSEPFLRAYASAIRDVEISPSVKIHSQEQADV